MFIPWTLRLLLNTFELKKWKFILLILLRIKRLVNWYITPLLKGSHSCGSTTTTITSDKTPLNPNLSNPCTAHALMNNQFFFTYTKDKTKFIHCDVWGHAWILNCPSNLVWSQQTQTCIEDTHSSSNPCTQDKLDQGITMFPLQDPHKYIHCDNGLNPWVQSCVGGTVFDYASQNCVWQSNSILG